MKILIYANGGEKIGLGHIMRCLRLAFYLKGCDISFASDDKKWLSHGHELIKNAGFKLYKIPNHQALFYLEILNPAFQALFYLVPLNKKHRVY